MDKVVLITGAAGFIGSHLALKHLNDDDVVIGIDNFSSSALGSKHVNQIVGLINKAKNGSVLARVDITDKEDLDECVSDTLNVVGTKHIDYVYNFACPASPPVYQRMPVQTLKACTVGVMNVLDVASRHGSVFLQASTSEVYGDPLVSPQPESYRGNVNTYGPRANYDEGKRCAEAICYEYRKTRNVDARIVRIFNTYGPHMDINDGRVITNFVSQALQNKNITMYGNGSQTRSFCYIDDLVNAITLVIEHHRNIETPVNVGSSEQYSVLQVAEKILSLIPESTSTIMFEGLPIDDPTMRKPDLSLAYKHYKYAPKVSFDEGLKKTIEYLREF